MDKAIKAAQVEIEEDVEDMKTNLALQAEENLDEQRRILQAKMKAAKSANERQPLMDQLRNFDKVRDQLLMEEKLKQDRLLDERRKARAGRKQRRILEVKQK